MKNISRHEFIEHESGDLALMIDVVSMAQAENPVFLVSRFETKAYLRRASNDVHEVADINPTVIDRVRASDHVIILEMLGETVTHGYDALVAILEDDKTFKN